MNAGAAGELTPIEVLRAYGDHGYTVAGVIESRAAVREARDLHSPEEQSCR